MSDIDAVLDELDSELEELVTRKTAGDTSSKITTWAVALHGRMTRRR